MSNIRTNDKNKIRHRQSEKFFNVFNIASMITICVTLLYPFWYILVFSFNESVDASKGGLWFWPRKFTLVNYRYIFDNPYITRAFIVSLSRAVIFTIISVGVCALVAYALSKRDLPGRKVFIFIFLVPIFISGTLISQYVVIAKLGFMNNFLVYVIPAAYSFFNMVIIRTFMEQLPASLEESAMIDGAGYVRTFLSIILPLITPILAVMAFFNIVGSWLDLGTNLFFVSKKELVTVQYVLYKVVIDNDTQDILNALRGSGNLSGALKRSAPPASHVLKMSTLVVITFPLFFVYPFFQRYFIKGLLVGAIKA